MKKNNIIGLAMVIVLVAALFVYIDFFAPSTIPESSSATTTTPTATTSPNFILGSFTLELNEKRKIFDTTITPWAVLEDSRCPSDVQCIQAGKVVVGVNLSSPERDTSLEMKPGDKAYRSSFTLTLKDVTPYPVSYKKIQDGEYRFIFDAKASDLPVTPKPIGRCYVGGCSGQICSNQPNTVSTCEYTAAYACYAKATCEMQPNGKCGWTDTPELRSCLINPPPLI